MKHNESIVIIIHEPMSSVLLPAKIEYSAGFNTATQLNDGFNTQNPTSCDRLSIEKSSAFPISLDFQPDILLCWVGV